MESLLILMVEIYPEDAMLAGSLPKAKNGEIESLLKWDLADLLRVSKKAGWLPHSLQPGDGFDAKKALVGDYLEILRQIRNLLHPGRYVREHSKKRVTNKHLQMSFEVCLAARDWLYNRVAKSLREHLKGQD